MAEAQAAQADAQQDQQQQGDQQAQGGDAGGEGGDTQQRQQAARTYSQEELDRILGKVRKNARYLGRKEAEAELRAQGATPAQARDAVDRQQQGEPAKDEAPVRKDDESWEDFVERKAEFAGRKAAREERAAAKKEEGERTAKERREQSARSFKERCQAFAKDTPDFETTIEAAEDIFMSDAMGEAIQDSELGAMLLYHLVKNKAECARIAELSPSAAARAIGKLEARLEAELKAKTKPAAGEGDNEGGDDDADAGNANADDDAEVGGNKSARQQQNDDQQRNGDGTFKPKKAASKAPDPIEPVGGRAANTNTLPSDKDDSDTWLAKRNAELARKNRR